MRACGIVAFIGIALLLASCTAIPKGEESVTAVEPAPAAEGAVEVWVQPDWEYPIAAGVWYPGDGPLPEHPFEYYRIRCWPGCHDPGSQPRPQHY